MCVPLPLPAEMAQWDAKAASIGLPVSLLMENAAREALHVLREHLGLPLEQGFVGKRILVLMGAGNNGGDAAALARHLCDQGGEVLVLHTRPLGRLHGAAAMHTRLARRCGVHFASIARQPVAHPALHAPHIVVDGLLGTGFNGTLRDVEHNAVRLINALREHACVLSLDVPSGLSATTGYPCPEAVQAHITVAFEAAKPGLVLPWATNYVGTLQVRPIGIPRLACEPFSYQQIGSWFASTLPSKDVLTHKGLSGHVLVVGGSATYAGAAHLAARGAVRAGAGLVSLAAPKSVAEHARCGMPDLIIHGLSAPLASQDTCWTPNMADDVLTLVPQCRALVLGPGMGRDAATMAFVLRLLENPDRPPTVLDADALFALAHASSETLRCIRPCDVLTPHPGEAATLLGLRVADIAASRFEALHALTTLARGVWVLKGAGTLVGQAALPDGTLHPAGICPVHAPNLAVAGSGDVLAGCVAAFLARGLCAFEAACAAVDRHAKAGLALGKHFPERGNSAADIADALAMPYCEFEAH